MVLVTWEKWGGWSLVRDSLRRLLQVNEGGAMSGFDTLGLFLIERTRGVGGPPDCDDAEGVDAGADGADARVVAAERGEEQAGEQDARGSRETAGVVGEAAAGGAHMRWEQFGQEQREPAEEERG